MTPQAAQNLTRLATAATSGLCFGAPAPELRGLALRCGLR